MTIDKANIFTYTDDTANVFTVSTWADIKNNKEKGCYTRGFRAKNKSPCVKHEQNYLGLLPNI